MNLQRLLIKSICFILVLVIIEVCSCRSMTGQSYDAQVAKKINDIEADYGVQLTRLIMPMQNLNAVDSPHRHFVRSFADVVDAQLKWWHRATSICASDIVEVGLEQDEPHKTRRLLALMPGVETDSGGDTANAKPSLKENILLLNVNKNKSGNKKNKVSMDVLSVSPIDKKANMNVRYRLPRGKYRGRTTYRVMEAVSFKADDNEASPLKGNDTKSNKQTYCSTKEPLPKLESSYVPNETVEDDGNSNSEIELNIKDTNYLPPEHEHCPKHYIDDP